MNENTGNFHCYFQCELFKIHIFIHPILEHSSSVLVFFVETILWHVPDTPYPGAQSVEVDTTPLSLVSTTPLSLCCDRHLFKSDKFFHVFEYFAGVFIHSIKYSNNQKNIFTLFNHFISITVLCTLGWQWTILLKPVHAWNIFQFFYENSHAS